MSSKIEKELSDACEMDRKKGEDDQKWFFRLAVAVGKLPEAEWSKLSAEAQDWANEAADCANAKPQKDIADFPDLPKKEEEAPARRRRSAGAEEPEDKPFEPKVGADVVATTKRGKVVTGKIVELDKEVIVLKTTTGDEEELQRDRIESIVPLGGAGRAAPKDEPELPADPEPGDTVTVLTKRGRTVTGELIELTDELIVVKPEGGDEEEFGKDRVESIKVDKKAKAAASSSRSRSAPADDKKDQKEEPEKRTRAKNGEVSVGTRIRELVIDDMARTAEDIGKLLKKEGIEFRDNTLNINYSDTHKVLDILKAKKLLK